MVSYFFSIKLTNFYQLIFLKVDVTDTTVVPAYYGHDRRVCAPHDRRKMATHTKPNYYH